MKKLFGALLASAAMVASVQGQAWTSDEDQSRFSETSYRKQEPGLLAPAAYVEIAKSAIRSKTQNLLFRNYSNPIVTRRRYRDAPATDRDIVCVSFIYEKVLSGGGVIDPDYIIMKPNLPTPVLQALIRTNGSKVYLNYVHYQVK